jgi:hypothetical protein
MFPAHLSNQTSPEAHYNPRAFLVATSSASTILDEEGRITVEVSCQELPRTHHLERAELVV